VRRAVLTWDRTNAVTGSDPAESHFDFLNLTGGNPDDTWTSTDYTTLEGYLDTFVTAFKALIPNGYKLTQYAWYRHGPSINPPNPAERVTTRSVAGTGSSNFMPPQTACSVTFRHAVRRSWGRTYLPGLAGLNYNGGTGRFTTTAVDTIANAADALLTSSVGSDFPMVVTSVHLNAVLYIEHIEVDDNPDVIRRRRWKQASYKKIVP